MTKFREELRFPIVPFSWKSLPKSEENTYFWAKAFSQNLSYMPTLHKLLLDSFINMHKNNTCVIRIFSSDSISPHCKQTLHWSLFTFNARYTTIVVSIKRLSLTCKRKYYYCVLHTFWLDYASLVQTGFIYLWTLAIVRYVYCILHYLLTTI